MAKRIVAAVVVICVIILLNDARLRADDLNPTSASITPSCAPVESSVTITVNATATSGVYFRHFVSESGSGLWTVIEDWSTDNTAIWNPETNGKKLIVTHISDDPAEPPPAIPLTMFSYESGSPNCIDPVAIDLAPTSGRVNEPVTITVTGARSGLYYQFWVLSRYGTPDFGNPIMLKDWSTDNICVWAPPSQDRYLLEV
jgi:hypothetical protein